MLADSRAVADRLDGLDAEVVLRAGRPRSAAGDGARGRRATARWSGSSGRIEPRKGPLDLVRAAAAIRRGAPGARLVVVGDDPFGADPAYTASVIASPEVEHHPWSDNAPGLMRHLDVLVLPSYQEPFGTVLAEAMAVGTPVVATRVDGLPEVVRDGVTGRLVEPGDPDELAAGVLDVLGRREQMGRAAREHARRFGADDYARRVERLLTAMRVAFDSRPAKDVHGIGRYTRCLLHALRDSGARRARRVPRPARLRRVPLAVDRRRAAALARADGRHAPRPDPAQAPRRVPPHAACGSACATSRSSARRA